MGRQYAKRVDGNQPELVKFLRHLGATFQHTHQIPGALDGIVGYAGIDQRVEIKDPTKPNRDQALTDLENEEFKTWRGRKPIVIKTKDDCLKLIQTLQRENIRR